MLKDFADEFGRYKAIGWKAIEQVSDEGLNHIVAPDINSIAMIIRHISGNLASRFTDFLTTDGEKEWRDRESEFQENRYDRQQVEEMWTRGWSVLETQLSALSDGDLHRQVAIRGVPLTVHEALCRSSAHVASHVGQIVLLARILSEGDWNWISIPKGRSAEYNKNPTMEKKPG